MNYIIRYPEGGTHGQFDMFRYPGGEVHVRLTKAVSEELLNTAIDTVAVVARIVDGDIMPVAQLIDALKMSTTAKIDLILPYLPYGRADRRFGIGDSYGLVVFARMINSCHPDRVLTLDAHSDKAELHIKDLTNVSPNKIIEQVVARVDGSAVYGHSVVATGILLPDKGATRYGYKTNLIASKARDPQSGKLSGFVVPNKSEFQSDNILIVDDICDGGGTFIGIAEALRKAGVEQDLFLYVTHGIFSKSLSPLKQYFKHIYTTDSFRPESAYGEPGFLTVLPCLPTIIGTEE
jgi:ribose-phosphate pyrophosphokinase